MVNIVIECLLMLLAYRYRCQKWLQEVVKYREGLTMTYHFVSFAKTSTKGTLCQSYLIQHYKHFVTVLKRKLKKGTEHSAAIAIIEAEFENSEHPSLVWHSWV